MEEQNNGVQVGTVNDNALVKDSNGAVATVSPDKPIVSEGPELVVPPESFLSKTGLGTLWKSIKAYVAETLLIFTDYHNIDGFVPEQNGRKEIPVEYANRIFPSDYSVMRDKAMNGIVRLSIDGTMHTASAEMIADSPYFRFVLTVNPVPEEVIYVNLVYDENDGILEAVVTRVQIPQIMEIIVCHTGKELCIRAVKGELNDSCKVRLYRYTRTRKRNKYFDYTLSQNIETTYKVSGWVAPLANSQEYYNIPLERQAKTYAYKVVSLFDILYDRFIECNEGDTFAEMINGSRKKTLPSWTWRQNGKKRGVCRSVLFGLALVDSGGNVISNIAPFRFTYANPYHENGGPVWVNITGKNEDLRKCLFLSKA